MRNAEKNRLGVVLPPANGAVEPEYQQLVGASCHVHAARFPVLAQQDLKKRLDTYNRVLPETIAQFGTLALDAIVIACSGSHYLLGPADDRKTCQHLSETYQTPIVSATVATLDMLAARDIQELILVSPYQPWLTTWSVDYWQAAGIRVRSVIEVQAHGQFSPYDVTTDELVATVTAAAPPDDAALFFTGTGMFTLEAFAELDRDHSRTLLSSNYCGAQWALDATASAGQAVAI